MEYELSEHARQAVLTRQIALEWIDRALDTPALVSPDPVDSQLEHRCVAIPEFGGRVLRVVVNVYEHPWRVVTVHFHRGLRGKI